MRQEQPVAGSDVSSPYPTSFFDLEVIRPSVIAHVPLGFINHILPRSINYTS